MLSLRGTLPGDLVGVLNLTAGVLATKPGDADVAWGPSLGWSLPWGVLKLTYSSPDASSSAYIVEGCGIPFEPFVLHMLSTRAVKHRINKYEKIAL